MHVGLLSINDMLISWIDFNISLHNWIKDIVHSSVI